jgi:DNA-binding LytR/AlgR family response regulator
MLNASVLRASWRSWIANDEPQLAKHLREQLAALWPALEVVHVARHGIEAAERIAALQPDLAFLDIRMPGLNGLEVAQGIEGATRVVFITAYDEFAVQAFEQAALDYVQKPVTRERLARTVDRLQTALGASPDEDARLAAALHRLLGAWAAAPARLRWVRASRGDVTHQIAVDDVLFFQADDKYTCVRTARAST